jgi:hypothetical protein
MDALLEKLTAGQIIALVSILSGSIVGIVMIVAITKYQFQLLADDTALKREKQERESALREKLFERHGSSPGTIEKLLAMGLSEAMPDEQNTELAKRFGMLDASAEDIERTLAQALATDTAHKKMIIAVMDELLGYGAESEAILAAVRPLCTASKEKKPAVAEPAV